ncbi:hypothetical protein JF55_15465 [Pseudomonas sp. 1-7]|nr:hypothetical protein JF55_15465 [Pseudomonas sp. 1-7]
MLISLSLRISTDGFQEFFYSLRPFLIGQTWLSDMLASMVFNNFVEQTIDRSTGGGHQMQGFCTVCFSLQGTFNRLHLASNAPHAFEQFIFSRMRMCHSIPPYPIKASMICLNT